MNKVMFGCRNGNIIETSDFWPLLRWPLLLQYLRMLVAPSQIGPLLHMVDRRRTTVLEDDMVKSWPSRAFRL